MRSETSPAGEPRLDRLWITTCMAPNMDFICRDLAEFLAARLAMPVEARIDIPWQERERLLDEGQIQLGWICGLPYVRKADLPSPTIAVLAAPVMRGERYQNRPNYFSDVVVRRDSAFQSLADLRGAAWAYNEPASHSGYNVVRYALAARGETAGFFGRVIELGAHQNSLRMILNGEVDSSAIDSTVLERETRKDPAIQQHIRVIETLGPSPIPPWVVSKTVPEEQRAKLQDAFRAVEHDPDGRDLLERGGMLRFTSVTDTDYDLIREMARMAETVKLEIG